MHLTVRNAPDAMQRFFVVEENPPAFNLSPKALGGTTARVSLIVDDPDKVAQRAVTAGARVVFPISEKSRSPP